MRIVGNPVIAALHALAIAESQPDIRVATDLGGLVAAEGELVGLGPDPLKTPVWLSDLAIAFWPGFQTRNADGMREHAQAIALIDPLQCLMALEAANVVPLDAADPRDALTVVCETIDEPASESVMLAGQPFGLLRLPVLHDPEMPSGHYRQMLPMVGGEAVMVRHRQGPHDPAALVASLSTAAWLFDAP